MRAAEISSIYAEIKRDSVAHSIEKHDIISSDYII